MKIFIMDTQAGVYGSATHRLELTRNLSKLGCDVHAIAYTNMGPNDAQIDIHIRQKNGKNIFTKLVSRYGYVLQLLKLAKIHHFDIVYTRHIIVGIIGLIIKKIYSSKLVIEWNSITPDERRLTEKQSTKWKIFKNTRIKLLKILEIFVLRKADAIIAVTQGIKDYLVENGINENKVGVIENGANTELFNPVRDSNVVNELKNKLHINNDEKVVLFVGNLAPWQGVEYLLRAAPSIVGEIPKTKFLIVGDGIMREKLESLVKDLNIAHNVILTETVPYEIVPEYINISDVCVVLKRKMSSGYSPLKLYEYMACGKPVIATNTAGFEILEQYNTGILVNPEDSQELASALVKLLQDKQLREQMGVNGRELVVREYSWECTAKKTIGVFRNLLNQ